MLNNIVNTISSKVAPGPNPAVYISGGLDSTIILHHLREKYDGDIHTYSACFGVDSDQNRAAEMVSEYYDTIHREVGVMGFIDKFPEILAGFDRPRFNVWPYFLASVAKDDGVKTVYNGEGSDQHFGGMAIETDYLKMWSNFLVYTLPSWRNTHSILELDLRMPFTDLDWKWSMQYFKRPNKLFLRNAYQGIIPEFVMDQVKASPGFTNYWQMWRAEIGKILPGYTPRSVDDIRRALQFLATEAWMKVHKNDFGGLKE